MVNSGEHEQLINDGFLRPFSWIKSNFPLGPYTVHAHEKRIHGFFCSFLRSSVSFLYAQAHTLPRFVVISGAGRIRRLTFA